MNTINIFKKILCTAIFNFAFFIATTSFSFCCTRGFFEEPNLPKILLKK